MVLRRPPPTIATVHRKASELAVLKGWAAPSYASVYDIARPLDPALVALTQEGDKAYRQAYDLLSAGKPTGRTLSGRPTTPSWTYWSWIRRDHPPVPG